jgi:hypothetical protein
LNINYLYTNFIIIITFIKYDTLIFNIVLFLYRFQWLRLCLKSRWKPKVSKALEFATSQGRLKFVRPLFRDVYAWEEMRQKAIDTYFTYKDKMMFVTREMVAKDLHLVPK